MAAKYFGMISSFQLLTSAMFYLIFSQIIDAQMVPGWPQSYTTHTRFVCVCVCVCVCVYVCMCVCPAKLSACLTVVFH